MQVAGEADALRVERVAGIRPVLLIDSDGRPGMCGEDGAAGAQRATDPGPPCGRSMLGDGSRYQAIR
jgi:hypothetical protein